jgi:acyl dehydratase
LVDLGGARMIEVGTALAEKIVYIDRAMLKAYADASGDQNPIHTAC